MDNTALIVDRPGSAVFDSLRHVINVYIVTKDFSGISVLCGNRCSRETDKRGIRQRFMNDQGITDNCPGLLFSFLIFGNNNPLIETILSAMRLVCHYDNVPTF